MHPKKVEQLAERIRENLEKQPDTTNLNVHLEAAHAKLTELQAVRRHMKDKLARCIEQRDKALREVDRLRAELNNVNGSVNPKVRS